MTETSPFDADATEIAPPDCSTPYQSEVAMLRRRSARVLERVRELHQATAPPPPPRHTTPEPLHDDDLAQKYDELMTAVMTMRKKNRQMKAQIRDLQAKLVESRQDEQRVAEFVESSYQQRLHFKPVGFKV